MWLQRPDWPSAGGQHVPVSTGGQEIELQPLVTSQTFLCVCAQIESNPQEATWVGHSMPRLREPVLRAWLCCCWLTPTCIFLVPAASSETTLYHQPTNASFFSSILLHIYKMEMTIGSTFWVCCRYEMPVQPNVFLTFLDGAQRALCNVVLIHTSVPAPDHTVQFFVFAKKLSVVFEI